MQGLDDTRRMVQVSRLRLAEKLRKGDSIAAAEIASLTKQEVQLDNLEHFARLKLLTRDAL